MEDLIELISTEPLRSKGEFTPQETALFDASLGWEPEDGPTQDQWDFMWAWFLAIPAELKDDLDRLNQGQMNFVPTRFLTDGNYVTTVSLLKDCAPGGFYHHYQTFLEGLKFRQVSESDFDYSR